MPIYSRAAEKDSLAGQSGISLDIPTNQNWYPHVLVFTPGSSFSRYSSIPADVTIYYNFPAFEAETCASALYNPASSYYNSFYGAYLVQLDDRAYGFTKDGEPDPEEAVLVPEYDFKVLVLESFGLSRYQSQFDWSLLSVHEDINYIGIDGWYQIDAALTVSGSAHRPDEFQLSYLQYGSPAGYAGEDFTPVDMYGRIYMRYFPEWNTSIFFYVIAADQNIVEECDQELLGQSRLILE